MIRCAVLRCVDTDSIGSIAKPSSPGLSAVALAKVDSNPGRASIRSSKLTLQFRSYFAGRFAFCELLANAALRSFP